MLFLRCWNISEAEHLPFLPAERVIFTSLRQCDPFANANLTPFALLQKKMTRQDDSFKCTSSSWAFQQMNFTEKQLMQEKTVLHLEISGENN